MASDSRLSSAAVCTRGVCSKLRSVAVARWLLIIARKWWCAWQELEVHVAAVGRLRDIVGGTYRFQCKQRKKLGQQRRQGVTEKA